jgi:hypothetical protein
VHFDVPAGLPCLNPYSPDFRDFTARIALLIAWSNGNSRSLPPIEGIKALHGADLAAPG